MAARPASAGPQLERLQLHLELATRLGRVGGDMVVHQPPASAHLRQIDT